MIRVRFAVFLLAVALTFRASAAAAQTVVPPASRIELGVGVRWLGGEQLGTKSATETTGTGGTSTLFTTASELAGAAGIDGRIGVRLSRSLAMEVEAAYLKPELRIAVSGDAEGAAAVTAVETIQQFTIGGNVIWRLPGRRWSPRFAPFATAGAGYLRQLHEQGTLADTGHFYQFGGGVSALLVSSRRFHTRGVGVRVDVRGVIRSMSLAIGEGAKLSPAAGASLFVRF